MLPLLFLTFHLLLSSSYLITTTSYQTQKIFIPNTVSTISLSPTSPLFLAATKQGHLYLYTLSKTNKYSIKTSINIGCAINVVQMGAGEDSVVVGLQNGSVLIYDMKMEEFELKQVLSDTVYGILTVEIGEDSSVLYTGAGDSIIRIYKRESLLFTLFQTIPTYSNSICSIKSLPNSSTIITGSYDRHLRIYSSQSPSSKYNLTQTIEEAQGYVCGIDIQGDRVVVGSEDWKVRVYRYSEKRKVLFGRQVLDEGRGGVGNVRFVGEGIFVVGGEEGVGRVYGRNQGEEDFVLRQTIEGLGSPISTILSTSTTFSILTLDGIYSRYILNCPKLTCPSICLIYSQCPTCYHQQYFLKPKNSKYCTLIDENNPYELERYEVEYELQWYETWQFWGALTVAKIVMTIVMRKRLIKQFYRMMELLRGERGVEVVVGGGEVGVGHVELQDSGPVELSTSHSI